MEYQMESEALNVIEHDFRNIVKKDQKVSNAYLLIHSQRTGIHMNIAEGMTGNVQAVPEQANYMASVGKIFTAVVIGMLAEKGELSFNEPISAYLDKEILRSLHVYKGRDYTDQITVRHLLKQTSGLFDDFWPLLQTMMEEGSFQMSPRQAVVWGKEHLESQSPPGKKVTYTDTNYHLLGLIAEAISGRPFHELLHDFIFNPLHMEQSCMLHYSEPLKPINYPIAHFSMNGTVLNDFKDYGKLDYAGGGVVAPLEDLLLFMQALRTGALISPETLDLMIQDADFLYPGMDYGYGIWKLKSIPLVMPKSYYCWGCVGATGAFMFYHPSMDTYLIGSFNDESYKIKGVRFMKSVLRRLLKDKR
jgi:D-alanyl-D-alanine carboxypeptidase